VSSSTSPSHPPKSPSHPPQSPSHPPKSTSYPSTQQTNQSDHKHTQDIHTSNTTLLQDPSLHTNQFSNSNDIFPTTADDLDGEYDYDDNNDLNNPNLVDQVPTEYKAKIRKWKEQERMKIAISYYYEHILHDEYQSGRIKIDGKGGVYGKVSQVFNLCHTHYATVKRVIDETIDAINKGELYKPERKENKKNTSKIKSNSLEMHQIAKLKINGSFRITTDLFNACIRAPAGLPPIGYTAIYNSIKSSNYKIVRTEKRPQSSDANLIWRQARFQSASQMIVRFGLEYPDDTSGATLNDIKYINRHLLEEGGHTCEIFQVAWWDEKHIEQVVGELRDHTCQFGFDENGIYCPEIHFEILEKVSIIMIIYAQHYIYPYFTNSYTFLI
jgi:hypothetical protein